jgi:hypothetical protein
MTATASSTIGGFAANSKYCIITMTNSSSYYYTTDGINWSIKTFPSTVTGIKPTVINDYFVVPLAGRFCYVSNDLISWDIKTFGASELPFVSIGSVKIDSDIANNLYVAHNLGSYYGNTANILSTMVSVSTINPSDENVGVISYISTTISNAKWVVKARP